MTWRNASEDRRGVRVRDGRGRGVWLALWCVVGAGPSMGQGVAKFSGVHTVDVPGHTVEIVQYQPQQKLLLATNAQWKSVDIFDVESLDPPRFEMFDFDPEIEPGPQGVGTIYEPTSVALHPTLPIAFVSVLGRSPEKPGRLLGIDLRRGDDTLGDWMFWQEVGFHPDSVAVSPDGRWAVVACEGEGSPDSPGSVWAVDIAGLTPEHRGRDGGLPAYELPGLAKLVEAPAGVIEPEVVAFDPQARFAVVTLQENDSFVVVDLVGGPRPSLVSRTHLTRWAHPDGIDVIDGVPGPDGRDGCLIAVAEEGTFNKFGEITGNNLSLYWIDPLALDQPATLLSRTDVRPWVNPEDPDKRRDPESVRLLRAGGRVLAILTIERGDWLLGLDVTDAARPVLFDKAKVGDRPEGLAVVRDERGWLIITGDEGNWGPGTLSVTRMIQE